MSNKTTKDTEMENVTSTENKKSSEKEPVYTEKELNEYVDVKLFYDGGKYKDDVLVTLNGQNVLIPRGKNEKVKRKFALVLEDSMSQDAKAMEYIKQNISAEQ